MSKLRTANLLGALSVEVAGRLERRIKTHPNRTDSSVAALNLIGFFEGCSNNALSQALKLSHTATVRLIDKLEAANLVDSRPSRDRRSVALRLTEAGRERAKSVVRDRCVALGGIVDALSGEQQEQLAGIAETLLRSLTTSALEAGHICRLCDDVACPEGLCPVHQAALELAA